jgi:hypothetical protein
MQNLILDSLLLNSLNKRVIKMNDKKTRDFTQRSKEDQQAFIENTWCDECQKENLGLKGAHEYELEGTIYIEGKCNRCSNVVVTEITDDEF